MPYPKTRLEQLAWQLRLSIPEFAARYEATSRRLADAEDALARAEQAREQISGDDEVGGFFAFPLRKHSLLAATAQLWLGGPASYTDAERHATQAVQLYEAVPPEQRQLGELCLSRLDLAAARLGRDDLEGAATNVADVLAITTQRRSATVTKRLRQLASLLQRPRYQTTALAMDLRDEIRTLTATPTAPALPAGNGG